MPSASLTQLVKDTMTKTGRPELVDETYLAVRDATKFVHLQDFFLKDSAELLVPFTTPAFVFQLDTGVFLPRFRKLRYLKKFDQVALLAKEREEDKLNECAPDRLFDTYNNIKQNVYYLAGKNLNIRSSTQETALLVSWYQYPNTDLENYSSWIADMYAPIITDKAAAIIFRDVGMKDDANAMDNVVMQVHLPVVQRNDIEATAR
jgi:hypothetical protein